MRAAYSESELGDRCFAVPKGLASIAQRFNAGLDAKRSQVPKGRLRSNPTPHPSVVPSGLVGHAGCFPALKRRAILKMSLRDRGTRRPPFPPVWCLAIGWCSAAGNFRLPRGASDKHTLQRSVRSEQRSGRRKGPRPGGLRRKRPGASLLLGHRALRLCSLVAPCSRPFWAQRNTSQLRDTTLGLRSAGRGPSSDATPVRNPGSSRTFPKTPITDNPYTVTEL